MSHISLSSPFIKSFIHADYTAGTSAGQALAPASAGERRIIIIIQNQSTTATLKVMLSLTGTAGISIAPLGTFTIDNYNGSVRVSASAASTPYHFAYATA